MTASFFCRECGEMWDENTPCYCMTCKCPCHGDEEVVHEEDE